MNNYIPHETTDTKRISMTAWRWAIFEVSKKWIYWPYSNYFTIVSKRGIPRFCIANTSSVMTGGGITHGMKARTFGWCKREVLSSRCMWGAVIRGAAYNLSNGRWRYAERPGTDQTSVLSKQAQTAWSANKTLISLELVKNLIMDICNGHGNSAEDII